MPLYLFGRDALLGFADQRQSHKPFGERQVRIVEDRAARGAELLSALFLEALVDAHALVLASLARDRGHAHRAAMNAANTVWPAHLFEVIEALIFGAKLHGNVYELHGFTRTKYQSRGNTPTKPMAKHTRFTNDLLAIWICFSSMKQDYTNGYSVSSA